LQKLADEIAKQSNGDIESSTPWSSNNLNGTKVINAVTETLLDKAKVISIKDALEAKSDDATVLTLTQNAPSKMMVVQYISRIIK
jgi:hypothetical protein